MMAVETPNTGLVEQCGCLVYEDERKPGGRIVVEDTQLGDEGLRRVKVMTTRYFWGFIYKNTDTDDNGCWKINKRYNTKRAKTKVVFRDRVSDRMVIRSWRGWRIWNVLVKPVKHTFRVRKNDRVWNNQCIRILDTDDEQSQAEEAFIAATVNNGVHDFYGYEQLPEVRNLNYLVHTKSTSWKAAPMLGKIDDHFVTSPSDLLAFLITVAGLDPAAAEFIAASELPDVVIPFQRGDDPHISLADPFYGSDDIAELTYHETAHAVQFGRLGADWWLDYVKYIISTSFHRQECRPYGHPGLLNHGRAEITEGMATAIGFYYADLKYEDAHSTNSSALGTIDRTKGRFINKAELADFWQRAACGEFIPEGLFFDLFDENDVFPLALQLPEISEKDRLTRINTDKVSGLTFLMQMNALNFTVLEMQGFKQSLFPTALGTGVLEEDYNELYRAYAID